MGLSYPSLPFFLPILFFIPLLFADNYTNYYNTNNNNNNNGNTNFSTNPFPSPSQTKPNSSSPFKPSTAVVAFVAILTTLFAIIFLLLLYSKHCGGDNDISNYNTTNPFSYSSSLVTAGRNSGINRVVVESLPLFRFSSLSGHKNGLECAVCLTRFEPDELLRLLPKCKHAFHAECVDTWLDAHSTCPLCRYRVDPEDILLISDQDPTTIASASSSNRFEPTESDRTRRVSGRHSYAAGERTAAATGGSYRKDGMLLKRMEHRIIVSGTGTESGYQQRWSDVQPSDLLYLRSEMIISQSRRLRIGGALVAETGNDDNNKNGNGKSEEERCRSR
ncbi:RING-H2 finger protein ATL43 [Gossypium raimondii]|uniref:RING-type E3 ubiquitin transferase n=1 Tax=Gossypium raimondii TaxID=29730 RepID=A0A0D2SJD8_GOSRA|nr:RING-H2 finger protein ATL43 [Gossypium raimondii]KJB83347.1 hypothetical protein B456_013G242500 [Gossypium raimondii]MBA0603499.1 hypothetical protein [Gossypium raimondii]